jgi:hypothetical protein
LVLRLILEIVQPVPEHAERPVEALLIVVGDRKVVAVDPLEVVGVGGVQARRHDALFAGRGVGRLCTCSSIWES